MTEKLSVRMVREGYGRLIVELAQKVENDQCVLNSEIVQLDERLEAVSQAVSQRLSLVSLLPIDGAEHDEIEAWLQSENIRLRQRVEELEGAIRQLRRAWDMLGANFVGIKRALFALVEDKPSDATEGMTYV